MRLIDADALFYRLVNTDPKTNGGFCDGVAKAMEFIINAPTIDAEPVKHGRWIWNEEDECWVYSECEYSALNNYRGNSTESNYCHNCGARMDGEQ